MSTKPLCISQLAYKKLIFHSLRYPSSKVYGALICDESEELIIDAYPLFHTALLTPSLSIALDLVESNLEGKQKICGFYEFLEDAECVMNRVIEQNQLLSKMKVIKVFAENNEFELVLQKGEVKYPSFEEIRDEIKKGDHRLIVDMDSHFDDVELDFRNLQVK